MLREFGQIPGPWLGNLVSQNHAYERHRDIDLHSGSDPPGGELFSKECLLSFISYGTVILQRVFSFLDQII